MNVLDKTDESLGEVRRLCQFLLDFNLNLNPSLSLILILNRKLSAEIIRVNRWLTGLLI